MCICNIIEFFYLWGVGWEEIFMFGFVVEMELRNDY